MNSLARLKEDLKKEIFWGPMVFLMTACTWALVDQKHFFAWAKRAHEFLLSIFEPLYTYSTFSFLFVLIIIVISPLGKMKIGGKDAISPLSYFSWFSIVLCTTIATGILFWGTAEPLYHMLYPPSFLGAHPTQDQLMTFSLSTVYLHWSFTPYAIYCLPALMFALSFYNQKNPYSLHSLFQLNWLNINQKEYAEENDHKGIQSRLKSLIDISALIALVLGMAASLGSGVLTLTGGLNQFFNFPSTPLNLFIVISIIVTTFIISASTGLLKGIRYLSLFNVGVFFLMATSLMILGPFKETFSLISHSLIEFVSNFSQKSLTGTFNTGDPWPQSWTSFYWANWFAWAPITAMFLGRLGYGRTVRSFVTMNWIFPALFAIGWMSLFSGSTLWLELNQPGLLTGELIKHGPESVVYKLYRQLPWATPVIILFILSVFISFVTSADSNTEAMASLSSKKKIHIDSVVSTEIKILWGVTIGMISWVMISFSGIDGIKMLSNLGGVPAVLIITLSLLITAGISILRKLKWCLKWCQ